MDDDEFFMAVAFLTAERSKDPLTQVGACVVKDGKIIATGYNGMPWGCSDDILPWDGTPEIEHENKRPYVCHAEYNIFLNRGTVDISDSTVYVGLFPCNDCAKLITQVGVKKLVYMNNKHKDKPKYKIAEHILKKSNVIVKQCIPQSSILTLNYLDFEST